MKPTTILIVGTDMMALYNHRLELIKRLILEGFVVVVAAPGSGEEKKLESLGVKFVNLKLDTRGKNVWNDIKLLRSLLHVIRGIRPHVVLTFYTKTNIYGGIACRITHTPYIENITGLGSAMINGGVMQKIMRLLYKAAVADSPNVFFQNKHNVKFFKDAKIHVRKSRLLPGSGVSLERFVPLEYPADGNLEFCFISRILEEKGFREYIKAAEIIKKKYPGTIFHIVGPSEERYIPYLAAAERRGIIKYHGKAFNIVPYLQRTHCTVFPSYYAEGMANVILESASCARPVITTPFPGCAEGVEDGVTGYLVKAKDVQDLVDKIDKFIKLPYEDKRKMGLNGRVKMENEFDRKIVVDAYLEEIHRILSSQNGVWK